MADRRSDALTARRPPLRMSIAVAAIALAVLGGPARGASESPLAGKAREYLSQLDGTPPAAPRHVAERLTALGPSVDSVLLALRDEFGRPDHVEAIAGALASLRSGRLDAYLLAMAEWSRDSATRRRAYRMLGENGTAWAIPHVVRLMASNRPEVKRAAETALGKLLRRHDTRPVLDEFDRLIRGASPEILPRLLACLGESCSTRALDILGSRLGHDPALDPVVVSAIARLQVEGRDPIVVAKLRDQLSSSDPNLRRESALALGRFRDADAVETLLELLEDDDPGVRGNAHWALRTTTGLGLPPDARRWKVWYGEELAWWETEAPAWLERLDSDDEQEALRALDVLAHRPLLPTEVADRLSRLGREATRQRLGERAREVLAARASGGGGGGRSGGSGGFAIPAARGLRRPPVARGDRSPETEPGTSYTVTWVLLAIMLALLVLRTLGLTSLDRFRALFERGG